MEEDDDGNGNGVADERKGTQMRDSRAILRDAEKYIREDGTYDDNSDDECTPDGTDEDVEDEEDSDVDSLMEEIDKADERGRAVKAHKKKMEDVEEMGKRDRVMERSQAATYEERGRGSTERRDTEGGNIDRGEIRTEEGMRYSDGG